MRKVACCIAMVLAGCAHVYDQAALPSAKAANDLATDLCDSRARNGEFHSFAELTECYLAADRAAAVQIKLAKMDIFEAYATRARILALDTDAGRLPYQEFGARLVALQRDFAVSAQMAYQTEEARQQRISAGLAAMGASMQQAGAAYQAAQPSSINCTTIPLYNGASTTNCR